MKAMTKAQQILALSAEGHTTRVIAGIVYGLDDDAPGADWDRRMAYVRVVLRQRREGTGASIYDRRYWDARGRDRQRERYHIDPDFRARKVRSTRVWQSENRDHLREYRRQYDAKRRAERLSAQV